MELKRWRTEEGLTIRLMHKFHRPLISKVSKSQSLIWFRNANVTSIIGIPLCIQVNLRVASWTSFCGPIISDANRLRNDWVDKQWIYCQQDLTRASLIYVTWKGIQTRKTWSQLGRFREGSRFPCHFWGDRSCDSHRLKFLPRKSSNPYQTKFSAEVERTKYIN